MSDAIRVNDNMFSWGSIIAKVAGERYYGFESIAYGDKRERAKSWGMGRHQAPRGRSRGKYTVEPVKLGGPKGTVSALRAGIATLAADSKSYGNVEFQIIVQYIEIGEIDQCVEINRVVWVSNSVTDAEGQEVLKEEAELDAMYIIRNGLTLFDGTEGFAP